MVTTYRVVQANWMGSRFSVQNEQGTELYRVESRGGKRASFFREGRAVATFECRATNLLSAEMSLIESAVQHTFGYIKPRREGWDLLDQTRTLIGTVGPGVSQIEKVDLQGASTLKALREFGKKYRELERHKELALQGKPVLAFEAAEDWKSITAKVLEPAPGVDERITLALAWLCLVNKPRPSG